MNDKPLVSVILCTYNDEKYIDDAITSVLSQTFNNFEFIIWNDGSSDGTEYRIKKFSDPRIQYYYHDNTGVGMAHVLATEKAKGKYIAVIDGDDIWMPERLEKCVRFLEKKQEYVLVCSQVYYINEESFIIGQTFNCTTDFIIRHRFPDNLITHSSTMFRLSSYYQCGGYSGIKRGLDHLLFMRMAKCGKMKMLNSPLIKYRLRGGSISHGYSPYKNLLLNYRVKMASDEMVLEEDVDFYNKLFMLDKKIQSNTIKKVNGYAEFNNIDNKIFSLLSLVIGQKYSRNFIVALKNCLFSVKYHLS